MNNSSDPVILFDGVCNLCNGAVNYVINHDPEKIFKLGALQSEKSKIYLEKYDLDPEEFRTVILLENDNVYTKSTAALRIARKLRGPARFLSIFLILPRFVRDPVYSWIAKNRFKWFGKRETCRIPTPEIENRFI